MSATGAPPPAVFARRPIVDGHGELAGYELLPHGSPSQALGNMADEALRDVSRGMTAHLPVDEELLFASGGLPFGPDRVVLRLPLGVGGDPALLSRLADLVASGYRFGIDGSPDLVHHAVLPSVCVAHVDARDVAGAAAARARGLQVVARDVETPEQFGTCRDAGFDLFVGAFLHTPRAAGAPGASPSSLARLRTAAELQGADDVDELERAIRLDPVLSVRLLRFVNSAAFSLRSQVSSVRHAVALLGPRIVRQWATLVLLADGVPDDRFRVLGVQGLARARTCEAIARRLGEPDPDAHFLVGLLSITDALLDTPLEEVLAGLPLADDLVAALRDRTGPKGDSLLIAEACERGDWAGAQAPGMDAELIAVLHAAALRWSDAAFAGLA